VRRNFGGEYVGIDISDAMVERARKLHPHSEILHGNFLFAEFSRSFDVVTANGIFYLLGTQAESLLQAIVRKMYALCNKTVAFNSLSAWAQDKQDGEYYADPLRSLEFCRSLSPWVSLRHDYHPRDFTIYLHKQKQT